MLRFSTYESIHGPSSDTHTRTLTRINNTYAWRVRVSAIISQQLIKRLIWMLLLLTVGCTGMVSAFANSAVEVREEKHLIIQPGDTLWEIAVQEKPAGMDTRVYIKEMKHLNDLSNGRIMAGEVLSLPQY
ncbi:LysM peptidoglycan-binding domain-containing protein [Paenibacillus glacialis]|uniref:LysM domain-containing protein n=1 Tax=Paenibacillus glacialis TaxID=494026 RepID=A0A168MCU0_9BACL|nr:LysM peptidoglycan-binding domain-containing protein [Paenibacillus glacialis]OAB44521.1 hypothetical protein PGLA_07660 [Paenibacillus glacialis]